MIKSNNGEAINVMSIAIANYMAPYFTNDELDILALMLNVIGDALGVISATRPENTDKNCTSQT